MVKEKPARRPDPLAAMLKEKRKADKQGKGSEVIARAELHLANLTDDEEDDLASQRSCFPVKLTEVDRKRLYGDKDGKGIGHLLLQDEQAHKANEAEAERTSVGLPLWQPVEDAMCDDTAPVVPHANGSGIINAMREALHDRSTLTRTLLGERALTPFRLHFSSTSYLSSCDTRPSPRAERRFPHFRVRSRYAFPLPIPCQ